MNLKCEGVKLWGDAQTTRRFKTTKDFIGRIFSSGDRVLDCSGENEFGKRMAKDLHLIYYKTTDGIDFDIHGCRSSLEKYPAPPVVFCFETLEHLMNPLFFLKSVGFWCGERSSVYVSYPRVPRWLQSDRHFHEFRDMEFRAMAEKAGFYIVRYEAHRNRHDWSFYFTGFRPFVRLWCMLFGLSKIHYYELKKVGV